MNTTTIDNSEKASSISFQTANGDIIVGLHAAKEYIKRMEILKHDKSISSQNHIEQEIQNCAQTFNISQETVEELKYLSDQTGMDTDTDSDIKEYDLEDTDSEINLISDSSSSEDTDDFDFEFIFVDARFRITSPISFINALLFGFGGFGLLPLYSKFIFCSDSMLLLLTISGFVALIIHFTQSFISFSDDAMNIRLSFGEYISNCPFIPLSHV